ncbi:MAG: OsmC family protein [Alphaproteobacteria bacterium]|nr:MAG: OsmC family protein [Alphaproteobacteria bacterium]
MKHDATVEWKGGGGNGRDFLSGRYSRAHEWRFDGGAVVHASASPSIVPVPLSDPAGVDPEEALVASVSSCHMLWFLDFARHAGVEVLSYRDEAEGTMGRNEFGRPALTRIVLRPRIAYAADPGAEEIARLHHAAHENCFIANSLRTEVVVE